MQPVYLVLILALLPGLTAELFAFSNKEQIDRDGSLQSLMRNFHFKEGAFRSFFLVGIPFLLLPDWKQLGLDLVYNGGVFLFWFNPRLNILRGKDPDYVSTNKKKPSYLDGLVSKLGKGNASALLKKVRYLALISGVLSFSVLILQFLKLI